MQLIDFHTHLFPDALAQRALAGMQAGIVAQQGHPMPLYADGTLNGLRASMAACGVTRSIVLPIATKETGAETVNSFAEGLRFADVTSFGSVHPRQKDALRALDDLAARGFKGIKLHPEYQSFFVDSPESLAVLRHAESLGLYVVVHAGRDVGKPAPFHCEPERLRRALEHLRGDRIIAAHMGGMSLWDAVEEHLVGTPILMDTACLAGYMDPAQAGRIIRAHGVDKVLFGSDSPWQSPRMVYDWLMEVGLTPEENEQILWRNALRVLGEKAA